MAAVNDYWCLLIDFSIFCAHMLIDFEALGEGLKSVYYVFRVTLAGESEYYDDDLLPIIDQCGFIFMDAFIILELFSKSYLYQQFKLCV